MAAHPDPGAVPPVLDELLEDRQPGYFTDADLDALPESYSYEIVDGILLVNPPAGTAHQLLVGRLLVQMTLVCPAGLRVIHEIGYKPTSERTFIPDLVVVRDEDLDDKGVVGTPLLVVEVRSPSTSLKDRTLKQAAYAEAGVPSYWIADPAEPSLTILELEHLGGFREVARVSGDETLHATEPYALEIRLR